MAKSAIQPAAGKPGKGRPIKITGRPAKFTTAEAMATQIDEFFADCQEREVMPTVPMLAFWLGFTSRQSMWDYENRKVDQDGGNESAAFALLIKKTRLLIEAMKNEALVSGKGSPVGIIFDLKNTANWSDKQEVEHSGLTVNIVSNLPPQPE